MKLWKCLQILFLWDHLISFFVNDYKLCWTEQIIAEGFHHEHFCYRTYPWVWWTTSMSSFRSSVSALMKLKICCQEIVSGSTEQSMLALSRQKMLCCMDLGKNLLTVTLFVLQNELLSVHDSHFLFYRPISHAAKLIMHLMSPLHTSFAGYKALMAVYLFGITCNSCVLHLAKSSLQWCFQQGTWQLGLHTLFGSYMCTVMCIMLQYRPESQLLCINVFTSHAD